MTCERLLLIAGAASALAGASQRVRRRRARRYTTIDVPGAADTVAVGVNAQEWCPGRHRQQRSTHGFIDRDGSSPRSMSRMPAPCPARAPAWGTSTNFGRSPGATPRATTTPSPLPGLWQAHHGQ